MTCLIDGDDTSADARETEKKSFNNPGKKVVMDGGNLGLFQIHKDPLMFDITTSLMDSGVTLIKAEIKGALSWLLKIRRKNLKGDPQSICDFRAV